MFRTLCVVMVLLFLNACAAVKPVLGPDFKEPEISYQSIALGEVSLSMVQLKPTLAINNLNAFPIPVDQIEYQLLVNDKQLLKGSNESIGELPAKKSKNVTFQIDLNGESLEAARGVLYKADRFDYVIQGKVKALGMSFPFSRSSSLSKPKIAFGGFKINSASFGKISMALTLDVENNNDFSIPLSDLSYKISSKKQLLMSGNLKDESIKQGKNTFQIPLVFKPNELFSSVLSLLANPKMPLTLDIKSSLFSYSTEQSLDIQQLLQ